MTRGSLRALVGASVLSSTLWACSGDQGTAPLGDAGPGEIDATVLDDRMEPPGADATQGAGDDGAGATSGDATPDVEDDSASEGGKEDGSPVEDAGTESGAGASDAGANDAADAGLDSAGDAGATDSGADASSDSGADAGVDAAEDGGVDAGGPRVLIAEVRSRGPSGAADEFVELYNAGASAVVMDSTWTAEARSATGSTYTRVWQGSGTTIASHGYLLIAGTAYTQTPAADAMLSTGITDASSLRLLRSGAAVDALCFYVDATTMTDLEGAGFTCAGTPVSNAPHDNTSGPASNTDVALERKPGGAQGNGEDSGDNSADFKSTTPANPRSTSSPAAP
jgi:hypothetical protein